MNRIIESITILGIGYAASLTGIPAVYVCAVCLATILVIVVVNSRKGKK
jgi:hypothetical protein